MDRTVVLSLLVAVLCIGFEVSRGDVLESNSTNVTSTVEPASETTLKDISTPPPPTTLGHNSTTVHFTTGTTSTPTVSTTRPSEVTTAKPGQNSIYGVQYRNGTYCILIKANFSIIPVYNGGKSEPLQVPEPSAVLTTGDCGEKNATEQHISIKFFNESWELNLTFTKTDEKYFLSNILLYYDLNSPKNISGIVMNNTRLFETSSGYLCMARKTLYFNPSANNSISTIYTEKLQLEAFKAKPTVDFTNDKFERCSEDSISNLVPIIVGACLGGLIIIVLIAYLIGRKRSRRGYESV